MNKLLLGCVGALAMVTSASAADLAARPYTKAPPPMVAALYDWSGFYIGMQRWLAHGAASAGISHRSPP